MSVSMGTNDLSYSSCESFPGRLCPCPCVQVYFCMVWHTMVNYFVVWHTMVYYFVLPYGILWFGRLYPCPYVQMLLSLTIVCRNFKSHYLQTNVQTNVQINVQTNVQINVQTNVQTNIFFVNSETTKVPNWRLLEESWRIV